METTHKTEIKNYINKLLIKDKKIADSLIMTNNLNELVSNYKGEVEQLKTIASESVKFKSTLESNNSSDQKIKELATRNTELVDENANIKGKLAECENKLKTVTNSTELQELKNELTKLKSLSDGIVDDVVTETLPTKGTKGKGNTVFPEGVTNSSNSVGKKGKCIVM